MQPFTRLTETSSPYRHLEKMSVEELLVSINDQDKLVAEVVRSNIPAIQALVEEIIDRMLAGGRLLYIGAGTSGRLGVLDASECPPTFGVPPDWVQGIIAGGEKALTSAIERAEDSEESGWTDLKSRNISINDLVIGITAGGTTPYVVGALKACKENGICTGSITCNPNAPVSAFSDFPVELPVGPEFVTGSTRMKAGTAQKMTLNMISTAVMVRLGRVEDNKMVDMPPLNEKLIERGVRILMEKAAISDPEVARALLLKAGSVRKALQLK